MSRQSKLVAKGVKYLLKQQGYTLIREYPAICAVCAISITGFDVKKGEEEIEIDLCVECMKICLTSITIK